MRKTLTFLLAVLILSPFSLYARSAQYQKASNCYHKQAKQKDSTHRTYSKCIKLFERAAVGKDEEAATYSAARLSRESFYKFGKEKDKERSIELYNAVLHKFPNGKLAPDALYRIGCMRQGTYKDNVKAKKAFTYLIDHYPTSKQVPLAKEKLVEIEASGSVKSTKKAVATRDAAPRQSRETLKKKSPPR